MPTALLISLILAACAAAQTAPVFAPKRFTRAAGPPETFTETFPHCGSGQQCRIVVENNKPGGPAARATISLNGAEVIGTGDLIPLGTRIVEPVSLAAENRLTVALSSDPGSSVSIEIECAAPPANLSAGNPGVSMDSGPLLMAVPIVNTGAAAAQEVTARAITLTHGTLASPALPFPLGTIGPGGSAVLNTSFSGPFTNPEEALHVEGTYSAGSATYCFALSANSAVPPPTGSIMAARATVPSNTVTGGRYPPQPRNFPDEVNGTSRWTVPTAGATTFATNPNGLEIGIDGGAVQTAPFKLSLSSGPHTIAVRATQPGARGTRYVFTGWSDGGAASHQIPGGTGTATYTATFAAEYLLEISVSPAGGGSISVTPPSPDGSGYYASGTKITITARPYAQYTFSGFGGSLTGTSNPETLTLTAPASVTANFTRR